MLRLGPARRAQPDPPPEKPPPPPLATGPTAPRPADTGAGAGAAGGALTEVGSAAATICVPGAVVSGPVTWVSVTSGDAAGDGSA